MRARYKLAAVLGGCLVLGALCSSLTGSRDPVLTFLAVGQGDCAILEAGGAAVMVDTGPSAEAATRTILPALRHRGIDRIGLLVLTHPDTDHTGGLSVLMDRVDTIAASAAFRGHEQFTEALSGAAQVVWIDTPASISLESCKITISAPDLQPGEGDNEGSLVVAIRNGGSAALLSGDIGSSTEAELLGTGRSWSSDILQAGHHGSRHSTSEAWLLAVNPRYVVFSAGRQNLYGHPHPQAIERVRRQGAEALITATAGDISFRLESQDPVPLR